MQDRQAVLGWTVVRVVFGVLLSAAHGLPKVMDGVARHTNTVASLGFPFPSVFAWLSALTELVGGLLIAVGLFTRPVALMAVSTMAVAMYRHRADPFSKIEMPLLFLAVFVAMALAGAGPWSLDARLRRRAPP
jgi:putative oxidoreductase